jgi:hypothetical protein
VIGSRVHPAFSSIMRRPYGTVRSCGSNPSAPRAQASQDVVAVFAVDQRHFADDTSADNSMDKRPLLVRTQIDDLAGSAQSPEHLIVAQSSPIHGHDSSIGTPRSRRAAVRRAVPQRALVLEARAGRAHAVPYRRGSASTTGIQTASSP